MLQRLTIENFIRLPFLDVKPANPVVLFAGPNESGKTTIAEALRFALRGENPRLNLKSERTKLLTNGASKGSITLQWDNNTIKRNIKDGKATGDTQYLPDDDLVADVCLHAVRFATLDDKTRRSLTLRLAHVDLSVDRVADKLSEKGIEPATVKKYRPLLVSGLQQAYEHARRRLQDARGQWREVTGEVYGSQKAEGWKPERAAVEDADELTASLAETDAEIATVKTARDNEVNNVREDFDSKIREFGKAIEQYEQQLNKPEPIPCPHCGGALLLVGTEIQEYVGDKVQRAKIETIRTSTRLKRQGLVDQRTEKLAALNAEYDEQLNGLQQNRSELERQLRLLDEAQVKEARAAALHQEIIALTRMQDLLSDGPDGVAASLIAEAIEPLNYRLLEMGQQIGWKPAVIHGDMSIVRADGHPYALLSESAQWRVDTMLHVLVSELAGFQWLVFDRMDVLEIADRSRFIQWIAGYGQGRADECTILVMATLKRAPVLEKVPGIEAHWLE